MKSATRWSRSAEGLLLRAWTLTTVLCPLQVLADALHRHGAFGDRTRHPFHRARAEVAGSKYSRSAPLQQKPLALQRPTGQALAILENGSTGLDETVLVGANFAGQPSGMRHGAD